MTTKDSALSEDVADVRVGGSTCFRLCRRLWLGTEPSKTIHVGQGDDDEDEQRI